MRLLQEYEKKRNFRKTSEPKATVKKGKAKKLIFVVQEHHASHLHYDFRLEMEGVLRSWSVPKGPSPDPAIKRLALEVEDHPIPYAKFEGSIPFNEYGGGDVYIWDSGTWEPDGDPVEAYRKGRIDFEMKGKKLKGRWMLIRTRLSRGSSKPQWLLKKRTDEFAHVGEGEVDIAMVHDHLNPIGEKPKRRQKSEAKQAIEKAPAKPSGGIPKFVAPELALLVEAPPTGKGWVHEAKFDGYRTQARVENGKAQLLTRTGQDWSHKYPTVVRALQKAKIENAVFDGEVVWVDEKGRSDFQKLQNALKQKESTSILYYAFDLLYLDGEDLRHLPLLERKKRLEKILAPLKGTAVLYSDHHAGEAEEFLEVACDYQLEGIISKRSDSAYLSGRNDNWVKSKCKQRQEFVIGGFTEGEGARKGFGALLLGVYEGSKLRYVGRVGTGFNSETLLALRKRLSLLEQKTTPFSLKSPKERGVHWVKPELVAEINFANWTQDGILRVPVFQGLREDKPAIQVRREQAAATPSTAKPRRMGLTHPEKVFYQKEGITKQQIADYLSEVSEWMLPHLADRPLSLKRCPNGTDGECFFQKHSSSGTPENIETVWIKEKTATREYMTVNSVEGLHALIQQGGLEYHVWNCRKNDTDHPDQMILDFDPGPGLGWKDVVEGVLEMKALLDELELRSFVKVSGSKGAHIHIPLKPIYSWDQIKEYSETLAQELVSRNPKKLTATLSKSAREKKIFIDYLRNAKSATAVAPYSLRARESSAVALPIDWMELRKISSSNQFTIEKALQKITSRKQDPWKDYFEFAQEIEILNQQQGSK